MNSFTGKTALITGAASGIGAACAAHLAGEGVGKLILCDINREALEQLDLPCDTIRLPGDVAQPLYWEDNAPHLDGLDFAIANAGIARSGPLTDMAFDDWRAVMAVNLDGIFLSVQHAMRAMIKAGNGGSIVLTASSTGIKAQPGVAAYGASKAAVIHLGKIAAVEAAPHGIRINVIAPGGVKTAIWHSSQGFAEMVREYGSEEKAFAAMAAAGQPLPRYAEASETAAQIAFMLDDTVSGTMTGNVMVSDGGYVL